MNDCDTWWIAVLVTKDGTSHGRADGSHSAWVGPSLEEAIAPARIALIEAMAELDLDTSSGRHPGGYFIRTGVLGMMPVAQ